MQLSPKLALIGDVLMPNLPVVSIVIPCRNEEQWIASCLDSIIANDFPKDKLEVLVVDGMSEDGTRAVLDAYACRYPFIKIFSNPNRVTPVAFNIGIRHARGDLIMIMSAHATYALDAIRKCAEYSNQYNADNVGGVWKICPRKNGLLDKGIGLALSHPFGVGGARYRTGTDTEPRWVDTAAYGCYKREVFSKVGLFNERLIRGQDMEFNLRLKKAGGKTLLVPDVVINYYARSDFVSFIKHNFRNGVWAIVPFLYSPIMPVGWRHLAPLIFILGLLGSAVLAMLQPVGMAAFLGLGGAYVAANLAASAHIVLKERDVRCLAVMPVVFASLHLSYGIGSLCGVAKIVSAMAGRSWAIGQARS